MSKQYSLITFLQSRRRHSHVANANANRIKLENIHPPQSFGFNIQDEYNVML